MTQWDFGADVEQLLDAIGHQEGPRSMSSMVEAAGSLVRRGRADGSDALRRWLDANAEALVGQQLLIANVHAQQSPALELPRVLREWASRVEVPDPVEAVAYLKAEHPGLLRAWLLERVDDLVGEQLAGL